MVPTRWSPVYTVHIRCGYAINRSHLRSRANLPQKGSKIEVDPSCRNLSGFRVVLVEGTTRNLNLFARSLDVAKTACVHSVKSPFHRDQIFDVGQVPNGMHIARERDNERSHEVISHSCLPSECSRRKVDNDIFRIVAENLVFIGAFPGIEILLNKCADAIWRLDSCNLHTCSLLDAEIASPSGQLYTRWQVPARAVSNLSFAGEPRNDPALNLRLAVFHRVEGWPTERFFASFSVSNV